VPAAVIKLAETDTVYVGKPISVAVSSTGEIFVTDGFAKRVHRYAATGQFLEVIGRQGNGPNEFMQPGMIYSYDDSTLLITDEIRRDAVVWDLPQKQARLRLPFSGQPGVYAVHKNSLIGSFQNPVKKTLAMRWTLPEVTPEYVGKLPPAFANGLFAMVWGRIPIDTYGDSIAYTTGDADYIRLTDSSWHVNDSIAIPRRVRRGIPEALDTTLTKGRNIYYVMNQLSTPFVVHRLSGGRFGVIYVDATIRNNNTMSGKSYLTVVRKDYPARCIDVMIPIHDETTIPRMVFRGDTLYVVDQYVEGSKATVDVIKFAVGENIC